MFWKTISFVLITFQLFVRHLNRFSGCGKYNSRYYCTKIISFSLLSSDTFSPYVRHLRSYEFYRPALIHLNDTRFAIYHLPESM